MHWIIFILIFGLDQVTKLIVLKNFALYESKPIIEGIFHLTYVRNIGAAFSILQNQRTFLIITSSIVMIIIIWFLLSKKYPNTMVLYSLILVLAGAMGNLVDRIRFGYVVDFFDFMIWPVFNIADMSIVVGAILLGYYYIFIDKALN
ncbi:MAG: signal peptidase II [Alkaliphilus sp.]|nr:signal peptidase II [Alkaliphilus sp.]